MINPYPHEKLLLKVIVWNTQCADGATVNRWLTTGFLAASASSNEAGYITHKVVRNLGMLAFDNQARV